MKILCFGEPVLRLSPRPPLMLHQADELMMAFVGSEVVVAKSLALQGDDVAMASVLSSNILGDRSIMEMRKFGVDVSRMRRVDARMAGYYIERGGTMRPDRILYDRDGSAMQSALREEFDWDSLLNGVWCFYFSGVVASITPETGRIVEDALIASKGRGIRTFCDLNYRRGMITPAAARNLWDRLLPYIDVVCGSLEDYSSIWEAESFDGSDRQRESAAVSLMDRYNLFCVAMNRHIVNPGAMLQVVGLMANPETIHRSLSHEVAPTEISGCGDAFSSSIVHGLIHNWEPQHILDYAVTHSAYKATVEGELSYATELTIEQAYARATGSTIIR